MAGLTNIKINKKTIRNSRHNKPKIVEKRYRINDRIRIPEIRVIDENDEQLGIMATEEAKNLAESKGLDLVEVSPLAKPPVCKIMDYGKFQYKQNRSQQKTKKVDTKGVRLSFKIGQHDADFKRKQVIKFLDQGHKVKIELRLKGRERAFRDQAKELVNKFIKELDTEYKMDKPLEMQGPTISALICKQ